LLVVEEEIAVLVVEEELVVTYLDSKTLLAPIYIP
jgi:hypothetical protein